MARYRPDGNIEYLGRIDNQVKVRGFRIELGEIESVLAGLPGVREAVVVAREDVPGDKRLVAYLTVNGGEPPKVSELRSLLQAKLPEYMVPSAFVILDRIPQTPNGKVDRKALPMPDLGRPALEKAFVAPRTSIEKVLADIWSQVLRIKDVGVHDRFFELGGDSILSVQVIAKANQAGLRLTLKQIFQHQTIAELALAAEAATPSRFEQGVVAGDVPLTPIQAWFFEQDYAEQHHWNQARLLELREDLEPTLLERAIQQLAVHHDALRLRFVREDQRWRQFNAGSEEPVKLDFVHLAGTPEGEQTSVMECAAAKLQASLNLSQGPLLRAVLFDLGSAAAETFVIGNPPPRSGWGLLENPLGGLADELPATPKWRHRSICPPKPLRSEHGRNDWRSMRAPPRLGRKLTTGWPSRPCRAGRCRWTSAGARTPRRPPAPFRWRSMSKRPGAASASSASLQHSDQ